MTNLTHGHTNLQAVSYTGSSETELLSKLNEHLPSLGSRSTSASPSSGRGIGGGEAKSGGQQNLRGEKEKESSEIVSLVALEAAKALIEAFDENVDVGRLLRDIRGHAAAVAAAAAARRSSSSADDILRQPAAAPPLLPLPPPTASVGDSTEMARRGGGGEGGGGGGGDGGRSSPSGSAAAATETSANKSYKRRTREEVEAEAANQGASGG